MTVYANLVDGEVKGVYDLLPKFWNGINNFDIVVKDDVNAMRENGFVKIVRYNPEYNKETQKLSDFPTYTVENGEVIEHLELLDIPVVTKEILLAQAQQRKIDMLRMIEQRIQVSQKREQNGILVREDVSKLNLFKDAINNLTISKVEDLDNLVWPIFADF